MQAAYEAALDYARNRTVFGSNIVDYQLTRAKLGRMATLIQAGRQFSYHVATLMATGQGAMEASMVKAYVCKAAEWVTRVFLDGSRVPLTLRRAEILALLDSRTQGWSAEELAYELYGDAGTPQAIRTEMFRVRSMLGDAVESNPYRLVAGLTGRSDSGRVLRLLRGGQVAEALEAYRAPLLSRSGALAVQLLRDQLDLAVGSAVRSSGDAGLLIRWLSTDMGAADFEAVEALGRLVGRGDARYLSFRSSAP